MPNRRRRTRVHGVYEGTLTVRGKDWPVTTSDLSLKGAMLSIDVFPPMQEECVLTIPLSDEIVLTMDGQVARYATSEVALDFTGMDEETYAHLSRLMRLKAMNADLIDAEEVLNPFDEE